MNSGNKRANGFPPGVLVDEIDRHLGEHHRWLITSHGYARRADVKKGLYLHREIMQPAPGMVVDHMNGNKLDNRRANLRVVTQVENCANRTSAPRSRSGYRGVEWHGSHRGTKKWYARVLCNGRRVGLGYFETPEQAHRVLQEFRIANVPGALN